MEAVLLKEAPARKPAKSYTPAQLLFLQLRDGVMCTAIVVVAVVGWACILP